MNTYLLIEPDLVVVAEKSIVKIQQRFNTKNVKIETPFDTNIKHHAGRFFCYKGFKHPGSCSGTYEPETQKHLKLEKGIFIDVGANIGRFTIQIANRLNTQVVGFNAQKKSNKIDRTNLLQYIAPQDLKSFGLIPEIIGRLPVLTYLNPLDKKALRLILTEPKNSIIKQYKKLFEIDKIKLKISDNVLDYIVDKSIEFKLGARGLRSICEVIFIDAMYELPSQNKKEINISLSYAKKKLEKVNFNKLKVA